MVQESQVGPLVDIILFKKQFSKVLFKSYCHSL